MKLARRFSSVANSARKVLAILGRFCISETFGVCVYWLGAGLVTAGVAAAISYAAALIVAGILFLLSVKPLWRWIR